MPDLDLFQRRAYAVQPDWLLGPSAPLERAVLVVADGRIAWCGPADAPDAPAEARAAVRLAGCAIVPGFIDVHHHVIEPFAKALTCGEPAQLWRRMWLPLEAAATPARCYAGAKWTFLEALRGGVTTIVEHAIRDRESTLAVHRAAEETGIRLVSSTGGYDLKAFETTAKAPAASASLAATLARIEQHIADCKAFSRIVPSVACGTVQSNSGEMIAALAELARERGILFQIHANEHTLEVQSSIERYGLRPIEYLAKLGALGQTTLVAHATLTTPAEVELLAETDSAVAYNPVASAWKGNAVAPALLYMERGVRVGLGSDATRNDGFRLLEAAETCQRIAYGLGADDFSCGAGWRWVHAATAGGAAAIGLGDAIGALVPGAQADFLVLDCSGPEVNPSWDFCWELVRFYDRADLLVTVVDGRPVYRRDRWPGATVEEFLASAKALGLAWLDEAEIVRLHPTSTEHRQAKQRAKR